LGSFSHQLVHVDGAVFVLVKFFKYLSKKSWLIFGQSVLLQLQKVFEFFDGDCQVVVRIHHAEERVAAHAEVIVCIKVAIRMVRHPLLVPLRHLLEIVELCYVVLE
jgi:hypothetical protein